MPALSPRSARAALAVVAVVFVGCTLVTAVGLLDGLDREVARTAGRTARHTTDVAYSLIALTASVPISLMWMLVLLVAAALVMRGWRGPLAVLLAGLAAGSAVELVLKVGLNHPSPGAARTVIALGLEPIGSGSYPSGHMLRGMALAFATAVLLAGARRRAALTAAAVYTAALAWSRIYLNEHWMSDVLGGLLLGIAVVILVASALPAAERRTG